VNQLPVAMLVIVGLIDIHACFYRGTHCQRYDPSRFSNDPNNIRTQVDKSSADGLHLRQSVHHFRHLGSCEL